VICEEKTRGRNYNLKLPLEVVKVNAVRELRSAAEGYNIGNKCAALRARLPGQSAKHNHVLLILSQTHSS
jgi:hypothetical protein